MAEQRTFIDTDEEMSSRREKRTRQSFVFEDTGTDTPESEEDVMPKRLRSTTTRGGRGRRGGRVFRGREFEEGDQERLERLHRERSEKADELIDKLEEEQSKKLLKEVAIRQPAIILDVAAMLSKDHPPSEPEPSASSPSWCICTLCPPMVRDEDKVCCGMAPQYCNSRRPEMRISIIDPLTLHIQQTFRNDVFAEHAVSLEDTNRAYRHAAYRQYTLWVH